MTLSTLVADLVEETAEGVREASVAAARRHVALAEGLSTDPTEADVDGVLASLFPPLHEPPVDLLARVLDDEALDEYVSRWRPGRTSVRAGGIYLHPDLADVGQGKGYVAEFPPIERELGVSVLETVQRGEGVARLTEKSVALARRAIRDGLTDERWTVAAAFADGIPTPVVESAMVEVRAAFGGGEDGIEATLLDGRDGAVSPELVGGLTADLRFVSFPGEDPGNRHGRSDDAPGGDDSGDGDDGNDPGGRGPIGVPVPRDLRRRLPGSPAVTRVRERTEPDGGEPHRRRGGARRRGEDGR